MFSIVDVEMRANIIVRMHNNRARIRSESFLVKDLHID